MDYDTAKHNALKIAQAQELADKSVKDLKPESTVESVHIQPVKGKELCPPEHPVILAGKTMHESAVLQLLFVGHAERWAT